MKKLNLEYIDNWLKENKPEFILCEDNEYKWNKDKLKLYHTVCEEYVYVRWNDITRYGCGVCNGKQVGEKTSLAYMRPDLLKEWDYEHNKILPEHITYGSAIKVWWICETCNYNWETSIKLRSRGNGCPACAGKVATNTNSLLSLFPEVASEWNYNKNVELTPDNITYGSKHKVWWLCNICSFEWIATPNKRTYRKDGCPNCSSSKGEKRIGTWLTKFSIKHIPEYKFLDCINILQLPFDFYLPDYNLCIEYDGEFHYEDIFDNPEEFKLAKKRDKIKTKYCKNNKIELLRIPYWDFNNIEKILTETLL